MATVSRRAERADAQRNRLKVLATADRLLAERGTGVTLGEVAISAGVGAGTVYRHFPTKDALLATVLDRRTTQLAERGAVIRAEHAPAEALFVYLRLIAEQAFENQGICEALAARGEWRRPAGADAHCMIDPQLSLMLDDAQRVGAVRMDLDLDDARAVMQGLVAMAQSLASPERAVELAELLWVGLRPERHLNDRNERAAPFRAGNENNETPRRCPVCDGLIGAAGTGRPPKYCSSSCRQKAFRDKRKAAAVPATPHESTGRPRPKAPERA